MKGWLKFFRAMLDHPVWSLPPGQTRVWLTILAMVNINARAWDDGRETIEIPAGAFITSQPHLAERAGVGRIVVRHALKNLERMGSIRARVQAKRWTLIEVVNWHTYQAPDDEVSQAVSQRRAKREPRVSHNGRMEEGKKTLRPSSGGRRRGVVSNGRDHQEIIALYRRLYAQKVGTPPTTGAREGAIVKELLTKRKDPAEIHQALQDFFAFTPRRYREVSDYTLRAFRGCFDQLVAAGLRGEYGG